MEHLDLDLDSNFEPQQRARSNTWPLPRPENYVDVKEEPCDVDSLSGHHQDGLAGMVHSMGGVVSMGVSAMDVMVHGSNSTAAAAAAAAAAAKKNSSRRNAWGNMSYADLITQAIQSSTDKRLTLSQIYDWMVQNVPYFKDKGDSNSSAGWKNSIRHNLSLHNRFMRVQNEGTGKSSWWMINPDAKPGKSARRRATSMETSKYEKKRGRVKKKIEALRAGLTTPSPSSSVSEGLDMFPESPRLHPLSHGGPLGPHSLQSHYGLQQLSPGEFRQRASSNASSIGRLSPIPAVPETDLQDSPWSPEDYQPGGYGTTNDRFNPDQLVDNIAESMKIRENGFLAPTSTSGSSVSSSNGVGQQQSSNSSGNSGPNNATSNGYGLCQPPSYGSPYSIQSDFRSLGTGCGSTSSTSSAASSVRASSGGLVRSPPQQQRILNGPPDLSPAPPPYSIATLQGLSPSQSLHSLSPPPIQSLDQQQQHKTSTYHSGGLPVHGRFCTTTANMGTSTNMSFCGGSNGLSGSGLLRAALAQGNNGSVSSHSPSPPEQSSLRSHLASELDGSPSSLTSSASAPTPSQVMSHLMGVLNNNGVMGSGPLMPNDLDLNLDSLQGGFEDCNVDEVIKHELSMDGSLDFNFSQHQQLMQQQQLQSQQLQQQHHQYQLGFQQQHHHQQQQQQQQQHYLPQHHHLHHLHHHLQQPHQPLLTQPISNNDYSSLAHYGGSSTATQEDF